MNKTKKQELHKVQAEKGQKESEAKLLLEQAEQQQIDNLDLKKTIDELTAVARLVITMQKLRRLTRRTLKKSPISRKESKA
jgi:mannitol-specific phosphotransferase system IIBC component